MYKKILVPIDDTETSREAVKHAASIAKKFGGKITLVHVIDVNALYEIKEGRVVSIKMVEKKWNKVLQSAKELVKGQGIPVTSKLKRGSPWYQIVEEAEKGAYDTIVMGAHGKGIVKRVLWGSVSEDVARRAPCPVIIVGRSE